MTAPLLGAVDIRKSYGAFQVLKGVSLGVAAGETFAIIGPNGAGKTTLFKALTGESLPDAGTVTYDGRDVTTLPPHRRVHAGFGRTFQVARVFLHLSVLENVLVAVEARLRAAGLPRAPWFRWRPASHVVDEAMGFLRDLGLANLAESEARYLSHGDKKRLEFAVTLGGRPRILMLDEPTAGMSPSDRTATKDLIVQVREAHGVTVVLTEHDMDVIFGLAHRMLVLNYGEVVATGSGEEVRANPLVREIYLGKEIHGA
jgi:branched-chain amino acid transport system ATP-binding protein